MQRDAFPKGEISNYKEVRGEIHSGDIILCSGSKIFSELIKIGTKSVWSHVGFVLCSDGLDRVMVMESVESMGVRAIPLSSYLNDYNGSGKGYPGKLVIARHKQFKDNCTPEKVRELGQYAVSFLGYPYDRDEIAKIAGRVLTSYFFEKNRDSLKRDREFICSEYVEHCYKGMGINIKHDRRGFVAPGDFASDPNIELKYILKSD